MPYARPVLVVVVWFILESLKVSSSCDHVFDVAKHKHLLTPSRKHTLHSFRAIEKVEKGVDRRSVYKACKAKKER